MASVVRLVMVLGLAGAAMAVLLSVWRLFPVDLQNEYFAGVIVGGSIGIGIASGLVIRRWDTGLWVFLAIFAGTLVGWFVNGFVRIGERWWQLAMFGAVFQSVLLGLVGGFAAATIGSKTNLKWILFAVFGLTVAAVAVEWAVPAFEAFLFWTETAAIGILALLLGFLIHSSSQARRAQQGRVAEIR